MDKFKFILFSIVVLSLVGLVWYWSVKTIESGPEHVASQKIKQLEIENKDLNKKVEDLTHQLASVEPKEAEPVNTIQEPAPVVKVPAPVATTVNKNQTLINELQKLVDDNVSMKLKSIGSRVGTVQKFLNIFNKTASGVDNDYGSGTKSKVLAFQKAVKISADGETGPQT